MRVLQMTQRYPPATGGVEEHVANLARRLPSLGVTVDVCTSDLRRDVPFERLDLEAVVPNGRVRRHRAVRLADVPHGLGTLAPAMALDALSGDWDLLHAHAYGYFPTFAAAAGRLLERIPLVLTPHTDPGTPSLAKRAFDKVVPALTLRRASRVIALTRLEAAHLQGLGVDPERIAVIPNGIDLSEFERPSDASSRSGATVLFVGRAYPRQKGLDTLVRALARLPRERAATLRIAGEDWGGHDLVRKLASSLGVADRVQILGFLPRADLLREYAHADVLAVPSWFDSFPFVLLEGMAAGLPVVASRVGGVPEVVEDGRTGLLVEPGNPEALASALASLLGDDATRRAMGARGRARADGYSWDAIIPRIKSVYDEALAERAA